MGGGTGLSALFRGLRKLGARVRIRPAARAAQFFLIDGIVTVTDDVGKLLAVCAASISSCRPAHPQLHGALARTALLKTAFSIQVQAGHGLTGHIRESFFLAALTQLARFPRGRVRVRAIVLAISRAHFFHPPRFPNVPLSLLFVNGRRFRG